MTILNGGTKKERADTMKEHRRYKQKLYMEGKLKGRNKE